MSDLRRILVTGDSGYVGSVLVRILIAESFEIVGLDTDYYVDDSLNKNDLPNYRHVKRDIRDCTIEDIEGVDAVIHLAGLSNDPLGELSPKLTEEINLTASVRFAKLCREAGVQRFVYVSSQSMYGISSAAEELDEDDSEKNPITVYAKTKWEAEVQIKNLITPAFSVICFRPSTVFGASDCFRSDIVFNNLVACAYVTGKIEIKSDGTPWRPVVHVRDVCNALIAGLKAPESIVGGRSYNVGIPNGNFTVRDLAEAAQRSVPGSTLVFTGEHGSDSRTYRVSFERIRQELRDYYKPLWGLDEGARELIDFFKKIGFTEQHFRGDQTNRLSKLRRLISNNRLDDKLRWNPLSSDI